MTTRSAGLAVAAVATALALAGCSGEEPPYDDGSYSSVTAADLTRLGEADVTVTSIDLPALATPDAVLARLDDTDDLTGELLPADDDLPAGVDELLALDPTAIDGLQASITDATAAAATDGRFVVLVFDDATAAIDHAAADEPVFAAAGVEDATTAYVAGNVVGYYAAQGSGDDRADEFAGFMDSLTSL